jgi:hypothetical protein
MKATVLFQKTLILKNEIKQKFKFKIFFCKQMIFNFLNKILTRHLPTAECPSGMRMRAPGPCRRTVGPRNGAGTFVAFFVWFEEGFVLW